MRIASSFLILVMLVMGITMMNNYDKIQSVQKSLEALTESAQSEQEAKRVSVDRTPSVGLKKELEEHAVEKKEINKEDAAAKVEKRPQKKKQNRKHLTGKKELRRNLRREAREIFMLCGKGTRFCLSAEKFMVRMKILHLSVRSMV